MHDGAQDTGEKGDLILAQRDAREDPTAVAQTGDEQVHNGKHTGDDEFDGREVELHLIAGDIERSHEGFFADDLAPAIGNILAQRVRSLISRSGSTNARSWLPMRTAVIFGDRRIKLSMW